MSLLSLFVDQGGDIRVGIGDDDGAAAGVITVGDDAVGVEWGDGDVVGTIGLTGDGDGE